MNLEKIDIASIEANPRNPRRTISPESLQELAESIKSQGLLQPITVRKVAQDKKGKPLYQIVLGERRWRACDLAELQEIDCIVRDMTDREVMEAMLVENLQRVDVDPIEEARYVEAALMDGWTPAEVGARLGKSAKWVAIRIQIASMSQDVLDHMRAGKIGVAHIQMLAQVKDPELRSELAESAAEQNWTLAQLRGEIDDNQRKLADAPWKMNAKLGNCPACIGCADRSDKQGDLFGGEKNALCLNGNCWLLKLQAFIGAIKVKLEANGHKIISTYEKWQAENGHGGFLKDEEEIKGLQAKGVKPRVLINDDGTTKEFWNSNDADDDQEEGDSQTPAQEKPVRGETAEQKAKREEQERQIRIKDLSEEIIQELIAKKLVDNPDETMFWDILADAIIDNSYSEELLELAGDNEDGSTKLIREQEVDFKTLRAAVIKWAVNSISPTPKDIKEFGINPKWVSKEAEKRYSAEQTQKT